MKINLLLKTLICVMIACLSCNNHKSNSKINNETSIPVSRIPVIFDTDANNELDDQHALAYLLLNGQTFYVEGVTVNATYNGGEIEQHYSEAERVIKLCNLHQQIPLFRGANTSFDSIKMNLSNTVFDGYQAVNFIIEKAKAYSNNKLVILAVGKLTNVALAIKKEPSIIENIRLVWLGSNYPEPGEYNLENDIHAMNFLLESGIQFEMVVCRYGKLSGTDAVKVTKEEIFKNMPGLGPKIKSPITGRHGGQFYNFGDYSKNLFEHVEYYGNPPSRSLFDMAAVAIVKNPEWADKLLIPAPVMKLKNWVEQPENNRKIIVWENFNKRKILDDFYQSLRTYNLVNQ